MRKQNIPNETTVLVVEDNVSNFVLIARMLGYLGIHCEWKTSGYEVVEYADTLPHLNLILMDINMPGADGYALTARIKATPGFASVPIVAVTANVMRGDREKSLEAGCDGYIQKPIDIDILSQQIERFLARQSND
ncbi:MAG: hypothetical protein A3K45_06585 [Chloroflexi bacterium RIFOXYC12_FULL_59_14]|nr:MAG: hypothetical protein A3K45_06585 [Chloroflexi bacterium RIFOXYC12_FULL_59_14]